MNKVMIGVMCAAQLLAVAPPAGAAEIPRDRPAGPTQVGTFVGARVRVPLGATREPAHAGLAFTATQRSDEAGTLRFAKGMELGLAGDDKIRLSLAGRPASQLAPGAHGPDGRKLGVSTIVWVGVGVAVVAVGGLLWFVDAMNDASE